VKHRQNVKEKRGRLESGRAKVQGALRPPEEKEALPEPNAHWKLKTLESREFEKEELSEPTREV
jgi:hypothetical protein